MSDPVLRVFSYLPNPRVLKAVFAARLAGVAIDIVGDAPGRLANWLWDAQPRPLEDAERSTDSPHARVARRGFSGTLFKTDAFLEAQPFGTVPAAFSPDGSIGIFESNSILRAVARASRHKSLYGRSDYEASRVDSFLDANLVFAREAQVYLLALPGGGIDPGQHARMAAAYEFYLSGVEVALGNTPFLVGEVLTIADISFACDLAQLLREGHYDEGLQEKGLQRVSADGASAFPRTFAHMMSLADRKEFSELADYLRWYREANG